MAMEMEWMSTIVVVVEVNFNDLTILENLRIDLTVDLGVHLICRGRCQCCKERWDLKNDVSRYDQLKPLADLAYLLWEIRQAIHHSTSGAPVVCLEIYSEVDTYHKY